jgi:tetratricopeptide (TPR) repeat protein
VSDEQRELAIAQYQAGQAAFERGDYKASVRCFEQGANLAPVNSSLGGDIRLWLVNAYSAADRQEEAISLCETLTRNPDLDIRKQGKRLLYILKAPRLQLKPEWQTQIPDLSRLEQGDGPSKLSQYKPPTRAATPPSKPESEPEDLSQMNTQDNGFLWVAFIGIGLVLGGLLWWGA